MLKRSATIALHWITLLRATQCHTHTNTVHTGKLAGKQPILSNTQTK